MLPKEVGFIVVYEQGPLFDTVFHDLTGYKNVYLVTEPIDKNLLRRLLQKRKIQRLTGGYLNFLVNKHFALYHKLSEIADRYKRIVILFTNYSFCNTQIPAGVLKAYKKKWPNLQYVLYYYDSIRQGASICANYVREQNVFDACYSFDETDARMYGLKHRWSLYSKMEDLVQSPKRDLYFCGQGIDKTALIISILENAITQGVAVNMHIANIAQGIQSDALQHPDVHVLKRGTKIPYSESLEHCVQARCILEIANPRHNGLTLRPFEAVCYNRKLLTNNKTIFRFPFYDSRYMQYFESVEDIDWDWVKEDIEVDYHYNGEFSPLRLLEDIITSCEEK